MRVVVTIQHPGHVHFFKHAIDELEGRGHEVYVFARENEVAVDLLEAYDIDHEVLAGESDSLLSLATVQATYEARLLRRARQVKPDVITAIGGVAAAHVATAVRAKSVVFYDTEHASLITRLAYPFADVVCTPSCYRGDVGAKHRRYPGYHELAYLHPDRFEPDPSMRETIDCDPDEPLVLARISSWGASHDVGQGGFESVRDVVERLEDAGATVVLTAEGDLPAGLETYRLTTAPERMHDWLAAADLVVSEGATTAAEAAVLGTPAVYVNSQALGYTTELEAQYGLLFAFYDETRHARALEQAVSILEDDDTDWSDRRAAMLDERIDVTTRIVTELETAGQERVSDRSPVAANPG
ncbi:DUF354 domain-containing protein [Natrialbaceae archaeon A-CW3]